jgi:hypothetical protein
VIFCGEFLDDEGHGITYLVLADASITGQLLPDQSNSDQHNLNERTADANRGSLLEEEKRNYPSPQI